MWLAKIHASIGVDDVSKEDYWIKCSNSHSEKLSILNYSFPVYIILLVIVIIVMCIWLQLHLDQAVDIRTTQNSHHADYHFINSHTCKSRVNYYKKAVSYNLASYQYCTVMYKLYLLVNSFLKSAIVYTCTQLMQSKQLCMHSDMQLHVDYLLHTMTATTWHSYTAIFFKWRFIKSCLLSNVMYMLSWVCDHEIHASTFSKLQNLIIKHSLTIFSTVT